MNKVAYFSVSFITNQSMVETVNIPRANESLDEVAIRDLMEIIIATEAIASAKGLPESADSAELVVTSREELL